MKDLKAWFEIYDYAFFANKLEGFCILYLIDRAEWMADCPELGGYCETVYPGTARDPKNLLASPVAHIKLGKVNEDPLFGVESLMDALIHEMSHAIFEIFACQCGECREILDYGGHGAFWLRVANAIESMSGIENGQGFGPKLDMVQNHSVAGDVHYEERKLFNEVEIRALNLDILAVINHIQNERQLSNLEISERARRVIGDRKRERKKERSHHLGASYWMQ